MEKIPVQTAKRQELIEITDKAAAFINKAGMQEGILYVYVPHTTCGLTINENADRSVKADIINKLEDVVPEDGAYTHMEGNSDAHIKSSIMGHSLVVLVEKGVLQLGVWQGIFLCEFGGPRKREVWFKAVKTI